MTGNVPRTSAAAKRATDIVVAGSLLLATAPVVGVLSVAIVLDSPGPVLYRARRVGRDGISFEMLKFRKMYDGAGGSRLTSGDDERFTRIGRILARTKLDELPQLWNVLRGQMSMVGPRPEDPRYVEAAAEAFRDVLGVQPGVTGLSQLVYVNEHEELEGPDPEDRYLSTILPRKLQLDRLYIERRSWALDMKLMLWTVRAVVRRRPPDLARLLPDTGRPAPVIGTGEERRGRS